MLFKTMVNWLFNDSDVNNSWVFLIEKLAFFNIFFFIVSLKKSVVLS